MSEDQDYRSMDDLLAQLHDLSKIDDLHDSRCQDAAIEAFTSSLAKAVTLPEVTAGSLEALFLRNRLLNCLSFGKNAQPVAFGSPLATIDALSLANTSELSELPAPTALLKFLSLLSTFPILTSRGMEVKNALLRTHAFAERWELPDSWPTLVLFSWSWMFCSYATDARRHHVKKTLNHLAAKWRRRNALELSPTRRRRTTRPRLVVLCEVLKEQHVQYRYFARYIRQLRHRFEVIIIGPSEQVDQASRTLADSFVAIDIRSVADIKRAARIVSEQQPDIVFWLSVGMATWGPLLAGLRFAPIQICGLGHSASTFIDAMDYFLTESGHASNSALFSEALILLPNESLLFEEGSETARPEPRTDRGRGQLRVGVPSNALKLNPEFFETLTEIDANARREIEFIIFPNCRAVPCIALAEAWGKAMRKMRFLPRLETAAYLSELNTCDIVLSSFPFGGLHSTVDALTLGIPVVCLEGLEPHARTDALLLRRLDLPSWLIAKTRREYVNAALDLIRDDDKRASIGKAILNAEPMRRFFGDSPVGLGSAVCDAVWAVYCLHETLCETGERVWPLDKLLERLSCVETSGTTGFGN